MTCQVHSASECQGWEWTGVGGIQPQAHWLHGGALGSVSASVTLRKDPSARVGLG